MVNRKKLQSARSEVKSALEFIGKGEPVNIAELNSRLSLILSALLGFETAVNMLEDREEWACKVDEATVKEYLRLLEHHAFLLRKLKEFESKR